MKIPIIRIGNSKGIRIPKTLLTRYQIQDEVELVLDEAQIIIRPVDRPRKDWDKAFQRMHEMGEDHLQINDLFEDDDFEEWK